MENLTNKECVVLLIISAVLFIASFFFFKVSKSYYNGEIETAPKKVLKYEAFSFTCAFVALILFSIVLYFKALR